MLDKTLNHNVVMALKQSVMFSGFEADTFDQVLSFSRLTKANQEQIIFQQGQELTHIYFVYDGAVKLGRGSFKGEEKIIEVLLPGRTFAEGVLFAGAPKYPVTATALKDSVLVAIDGKKLLSLLKNSTELCLKMLSHLSVRLHWMVKELDKQTLHNASFRMVDYFLTHVNHPVGNTCEFKLPVPKRDIASRLSIKPETFSRALKSLQNKGLITIQEQTICLHDVALLKEMIELEEL